MDSSSSLKTVRWWNLYLVPVHHGGKQMQRSGPSGGVAEFTIPLFVFVLVSFCSNYSILSSGYFFEGIMARAAARARTPEEREKVERVREATELGLRNPVARGLISFEYSFISIRSLVLAALGAWLALSLLTDRWEVSGYWMSVSVSSSVLVLGVLIHLPMKLIMLDEDAGLSISLFLGRSHLPRTMYEILVGTNVFVLWFFWIVAVRTSPLYDERPNLIFVIFLLVWFVVLLASILGKIQTMILF